MEPVVIEQFFLGRLAHASYIVASEGIAAVIDPQRDVDSTSNVPARKTCASSTSSRPISTPTSSPAISS